MKKLTVLMILPTTKKRPPKQIAIVADKLILPLAVLSATLLWDCPISVRLDPNLRAQHNREEISKPRRGKAKRSPVPAVLLLWLSILPFYGCISK